MTDIPGDLKIRVRSQSLPLLKRGSFTAAQALAIPLREGLSWSFDGGHGGFGPPSEPAWFVFSIGWHEDMAGKGYEDTCAAAAHLAAHLVSAAEWPAAEVHVRSMPVIEFSFDFIATSVPLPAHPGPGLPDAFAARVAAMIR